MWVLQQNPQLNAGVRPALLLLGAALVEFSLGYLLIIGLMERPLALVITLVFFTTTLIFGKTGGIGHTLIHGALVVFLLEGRGRVHRPPVRFHQRPALQTAFASVNFLLLLLPYGWGATRRFQEHSTHGWSGAAPAPLAPPR